MNQENPILSPKTPYVGVIPGGLTVGKAIVIKGLALAGKEKSIAVNLSVGLLVDGDTLDNIAFHLNPRFPENTVVLNTLTDSRWGKEEIYPNPLKIGQAVEIRILPLTNFYSIALNGRHLGDYQHRIPLAHVKTLYIKGCIQIDFIEYEAGFTQAPQPAGAVGSQESSAVGSISAHLPAGAVLPPATIYKPPVPFVSKLAGVIAGQQFYIVGTPKLNGDTFVVNFKIKKDIAFHVSIRLKKNTVVRNSYRNGKWESEEVAMPYMPFLPGGTFDLQIVCDEANFKVAVNGQHFIYFNHRMKFQQIDCLEIDGDVQLQQVVI